MTGLVFVVVFFYQQQLLLLMLFVGIILCFLAADLIVFFLFFEFILFPIILYLCYGKTGDRFGARIYFILYTIILSIPTFIGIILRFSLGNLNFIYLLKREELHL